MRVAIIGCGAMGTVLGAYMTKNGCSVDMVDSYVAHVKAMKEKGAHVTGTVDFVTKVNALQPEEMEGIYDIIFLFTKQTANDAVLPGLLKHLGENSTVCTLQNGVPEPYVADIIGEERTVGGTVLWGATFSAPGVSELTQDITKNDHLFEIGGMQGAITERVQKVAEILNYVGPAKISTELMNSRWGKLINNACMSGMSAVCGCTFGEVLQHDRARACLSYIGQEVKQCCEADGKKLPILLNELPPDTLDLKDQNMFEENQKMFLKMYEDMYPAKASMLQDLEKGNPTEVKMINGYVCQIGDQYGIDTPFNDKVVEIVTKIENKELLLSMENVKYFEEDLFQYK